MNVEMEKGKRNFRKIILEKDDQIECLCVVPEAKDGLTASDDKVYLKSWAGIPQQTHSLNVGIVENPCQEFPDTDALMTFIKDTPIGVVTADCVPILLYAPDIKAVAAVHAGWKGTIGGIIDHVLDEMENRSANLSKMRAIFGPSISKEIYEVDSTLGERFVEAGFGGCVSWPSGPDGKPHLDLQGVNIERMVRRGVKADNIRLNTDCTFSSDEYHSYRRDGDNAGRQLTAIKLL